MPVPTKIYLQVELRDDHEIHAITWCEDKQFDSDVEYVRADLLILCREYFEDPDNAPVTGDELYLKIREVIGD